MSFHAKIALVYLLFYISTEHEKQFTYHFHHFT